MESPSYSFPPLLNLLSVGPVEESPTCLSTFWVLVSLTVASAAVHCCHGIIADPQTWPTSLSLQNNSPEQLPAHNIQSQIPFNVSKCLVATDVFFWFLTKCWINTLLWWSVAFLLQNQNNFWPSLKVNAAIAKDVCIYCPYCWKEDMHDEWTTHPGDNHPIAPTPVVNINLVYLNCII